MRYPTKTKDTTIGSYHAMLAKWCQAVRPRNILEWGPGPSTALMHHTCPQAKIVTIEHEAKWAEKARTEHAVYAHVVHEKIRPSNWYCVWPLLNEPGTTYDLVFVDGRLRTACLLTASLVLSERGVIVLHDSQRPAYNCVFSAFDVLEERDATAVLRPRHSAYANPDAAFPPVTCVCPTYGRFGKLRESLACFLAQTYPNKRLLILNDSEVPITLAEPYPNVMVLNVNKRFETLGEKRQYLLDLTTTPLLLHWDDDDILLPWHIAQSVAGLEPQGWVATPKHVWDMDGMNGDVQIKRLWEFTVDGCMLVRRDAVCGMGGYPAFQRGQGWRVLQNAIRATRMSWYDVRPYPAVMYRSRGDGTHTSDKAVRNRDDYTKANQDFGDGSALTPATLKPYYDALARDATRLIDPDEYQALVALCEPYREG